MIFKIRSIGETIAGLQTNQRTQVKLFNILNNRQFLSSFLYCHFGRQVIFLKIVECESLNDRPLKWSNEYQHYSEYISRRITRA